MNRVHQYKRLENSVVRKVKDGASNFGRGVARVFKAVYAAFSKQWTIAFVPHSQEKVYNLHVSLFSLCVTALMVIGAAGGAVWYFSTHNSYEEALAVKDARLHDVQANLDSMRQEMTGLWKEARDFQSTLSGILTSLGVTDVATPDFPGAQQPQGDLSSFFDTRETAEGRVREIDDIKSLSTYLASAQEPLREMGSLLSSQSSLLTEVPNIWPIKGGIGHISMSFGQNPNPFTGLFYVHKGIDISTYRAGDPIVATADGQVVTVDYDPVGFGNYVIIRHKHGFYTRYGHMQSFKVKVGQRVEQGNVIGYIGNTGLSTGPHCHYEVHIGSDVVDPYKFLNIKGRKTAKNGGGKS
jgi:murein DD-endopeptidase MepM/ murein hydrolase activator NlpD